MRLKGKIALVTGASSGVGAAVAKSLAAEGATVIINWCHNQKGAERTARSVRRLKQDVLVVQADVGDSAAVAAMFEAVRKWKGRLDILVNNAGLTLKKPFAHTTEAEWDAIHATNLKSVFLCCRAALPLMRRGGAILNISSTHAARTTFNFAVYAASKGGMEALTRSLAIELGEHGIRVNALRLGLINVEHHAVRPGFSGYREICARIPLGRPGETQDVAPMAVFLCSEQAAYITGQVIALDGGAENMLNTAFAKGHVRGGARDK